MYNLNYKLFNILKKNYYKKNQIDEQSKWWARKISRLEGDIKNKDFSNFRGIDTGMNASFSDSENTNIGTTLKKRKKIIFNIFNQSFIAKIFNQQVNITNKYLNRFLVASQNYYLQNDKVLKLTENYDLSNTAGFGCISKVKINNLEVSFRALEMINKINEIRGLSNLEKSKTYCEIGGGFGLNAQLILNNFKNIKKFLYIDTYPTIFYGTEYLRNYFNNSVIDYSETIEMKEIKFSDDDKLQIICIPSWEMKKLNVEIDHFHNAFSFVEMNENIVENYLNYLKKFKTKSQSLILYPHTTSGMVPIKLEDIKKIYKKLNYFNFKQYKLQKLLNFDLRPETQNNDLIIID